MLNFDGDVDANANANVKCEHSLRALHFKTVDFISVVNYVLVFHNKQLRSGLLPTFVSVNYLMEYTHTHSSKGQSS